MRGARREFLRKFPQQQVCHSPGRPHWAGQDIGETVEPLIGICRRRNVTTSDIELGSIVMMINSRGHVEWQMGGRALVDRWEL